MYRVLGKTSNKEGRFLVLGGKFSENYRDLLVLAVNNKPNKTP